MADGLLLKYFVLKPRGSGIYAAASRAAMLKYADIVERENPDLAREVRWWACDEAALNAKLVADLDTDGR